MLRISGDHKDSYKRTHSQILVICHNAIHIEDSLINLSLQSSNLFVLRPLRIQKEYLTWEGERARQIFLQLRKDSGQG